MQAILSVAGGVVQDAFATDPNLELVVVDWDAEATEALTVASVSRMAVSPLAALAGTDVARVVAASGYDIGVDPAAQPTPHPTPPLDPSSISRKALIEIVVTLQQLLYRDVDASGQPCWNIDKPWAPSDVCMELAGLLEQHGLSP